MYPQSSKYWKYLLNNSYIQILIVIILKNCILFLSDLTDLLYLPIVKNPIDSLWLEFLKFFETLRKNLIRMTILILKFRRKKKKVPTK